jgi:hypothetical protein
MTENETTPPADEGRLDRQVGRPVDEQAGTGPPGTHGCACVSRSAHACAELRYGYREIPEPCECLCHNWEDDDDDLG